MDIVVEPFSVTYKGKDADENVVRAQALGESIVGAARVYMAVMHYCVYGSVPRGNYKKHFMCYARPPQPGSFEYAIFMATLANEWALHGTIYRPALSFVFSRTVAAVKKLLVRKGDTVQIVETLAASFSEQAKAHAEVNLVLANGIVRANDNMTALMSKMIDTMPQLADAARPGAKQLVTPIGPSCREIVQFTGNEAVTIGEPEAAAIRDQSLEVGDTQSYRSQRITEVNTQTGHCILLLEGFAQPVSGKITDPTLQVADNVYTSSLNAMTPFRIVAKPVLRDGAITKLYISDAQKLSE